MDKLDKKKIYFQFTKQKKNKTKQIEIIFFRNSKFERIKKNQFKIKTKTPGDGV